VATVLVATGWSAVGSAALPTPEELPASLVAVVSDVPVSRGRITRAEFQHALLLSSVQAGRDSVSKPGEDGYERLKRRTLAFIFEGLWVVGQGAEMGIAVTRAEVANRLESIKKQSFKSEAEYLRFLRETHYTKRDVHERVEVELLSLRIQRRLLKRIERDSRNEYEEKRAFKEFITEFTERWRSRTVCAPEFAIDRCSNGLPSDSA
jgi:SurA N-terminal domain